MKTKIWSLGLAGLLAYATGTVATTYYINDTSLVGDVYCTQLGNDANDGRTPSTPKLTLGNLLASTNLLPGDVVYIDTGVYPDGVIFSSAVNGNSANPILFQGASSTTPKGSGTVFASSGINFEINGNYLHFKDICLSGGSYGMKLVGSSYGQYERIYAISNSAISIRLEGASNSNAFRRCVLWSLTLSALNSIQPAMGNYMEHSISYSRDASSFVAASGVFTNIVSCISIAPVGIANETYTPDGGTRNIFFNSERVHGTYDTLAELQRINTNWYGNMVADPKFVNAEGLDFHLLSAAGFVSNGVWVTNAAVGFSPAIDFGPRE